MSINNDCKYLPAIGCRKFALKTRLVIADDKE